MTAIVKQDSEGIISTAEQIEEKAQAIQNAYNAIMEATEREIGSTENHRTWYGPKAAEHLKKVQDKKSSFDTANENIRSLGNNLREHAKAWQNFEETQ